MEIGMGQSEQFDCSGFIIHAISRVMDKEVDDWPSALRHSRQMWSDARSSGCGFELADAMPGSLLVMRRTWNYPDGSVREVPAHIGIVTGMGTDGLPVLLHAQAGSGYGAVIERPMKTTKNVLGAIRFARVVSETGRLVFTSTLED